MCAYGFGVKIYPKNAHTHTHADAHTHTRKRGRKREKAILNENKIEKQ